MSVKRSGEASRRRAVKNAKHPSRPCLDCGVLCGATRCADCRRKYRAARWEHPAYKAWGRPRKGLPCALRISPNCTGIANSWDHIDSDARNHALTNRQGSCVPCNASKGNRRK